MATTPGNAGMPGDMISGKQVTTADRFKGAKNQLTLVTEMADGIKSARMQDNRTNGEQRNRRKYIPKSRVAVTGSGEASGAEGQIHGLHPSIADTGQDEEPMPPTPRPGRAAFMRGR